MKEYPKKPNFLLSTERFSGFQKDQIDCSNEYEAISGIQNFSPKRSIFIGIEIVRYTLLESKRFRRAT